MLARTKGCTAFFLLLLGLTCTASAYATVTVVGTRIIYQSGTRATTIQFNNRGDQPRLVQVWLDRGNKKSTPETADAPFIATPKIFRMNPHTGQSVRLAFTGDQLPRDRESLFFLNFTQIPPTRPGPQDGNHLVLVFTSRLKLLYRPDGLPGSPADLPRQIQVRSQEDGGQLTLHVENPTPYYAVVRRATLLLGGRAVHVAAATQLAPGEQTTWAVPGEKAAPASGARLRLVLVNDAGADYATELPLR